MIGSDNSIQELIYLKVLEYISRGIPHCHMGQVFRWRVKAVRKNQDCPSFFEISIQMQKF